MAKKGVEIIVGTLQDATFGPMVMVGLGGITTELFRDVIYRPAPVSAAEAAAMLAELKAAPLLNGFAGRGESGCSRRCRNLIAQVSLLAARLAREIAEIELNPVLVHPEGQGVTIVDALVVRKRIVVVPAKAGTHNPASSFRGARPARTRNLAPDNVR